MLNVNSRTIAVDFDGTIVENAYPAIGREQLFAFQTLREMQKRGERLILWTCRQGQELEAAVSYCEKHGIYFYAINKNYPEEQIEDNTPRKLNADIFIDDRSIGGFIGWDKVWEELYPGEGIDNEKKKRKGWW